jgi:hypothetical protein
VLKAKVYTVSQIREGKCSAGPGLWTYALIQLENDIILCEVYDLGGDGGYTYCPADNSDRDEDSKNICEDIFEEG